jgi:hypothetical protein
VSDSCFKFMLACYLNYLNYNHLVNCYVITIIIIFFDVSLVQGYFCYLEVVLIKNVFFVYYYYYYYYYYFGCWHLF